jgi:hypothetical protein
VRTALRAALPQGLVVGLTPLDPLAPTFDVTVGATGIEHNFVGGWAGEGWPADVERLVRVARKVDVVFARDLSVGAREWLAEQGIGWVDEVGRANLSLRSGLVVVRDHGPRPLPATAADSNGWSRSAVAVAEAALAGVAPRVETIEQATGLSRGATAKALAQLEQLGLLHRDARRGPGSARQISNSDLLLDAYTAAVALLNAKAPAVFLHRLWDGPLTTLGTDVAPALRESGVGWAVTGGAASMLLAPYLSSISTIELYVATALFDDRGLLAETLGARVVERGQRIEVRELPNRITATAGLIVDGVRCAPSARVYADLAARGGRSAEAANHLREVLHVGTGP